ncbi:phosphoenolpyruvate--protein phosphotransferase [Asaia krungthepensis]|uniref:Phosphoenolpyruvate-protein phosphotransferase n=1 Tax=Asaia krungthepensis NRIC 0535 TaxID=1307925 RepID=A0ABQ0PVT4_9PROT|nr:phosphoenolpyruvate--protein phosphotransferase [Asaia krungthepensis]GBQ82863.1 phosphoenolpyruvate-protein phosphotransferase [Asaia krungthepensis NRIC 0535]
MIKRLRRPSSEAVLPVDDLPMEVLRGAGISPGVVIARASLTYERPLPVIERLPSELTIEAEQARLDQAIALTLKQLRKLRTKLNALPEEGRIEIDALLSVYERMLNHSRLVRAAQRRIAEDGITAEAAVQVESDALAAMAGPQPGMPEEEIEGARRREGEFREVARRLLRNLTGVSFRAFSDIPGGSILVAEQIRPADAAVIDPNRIAAVLSEGGGVTDHTAIMLRALNVPAILAVPHLTDRINDGDLLIIDGTTGKVILHPDSATLAEARSVMADEARERKGIGRLRRLPSRLVSGEDIELLANVELANELPLLHRNGAAGIGLLRTEFLFDESEALPDEDGQYETYAGIVADMPGMTTTIRVLDWGGEKGLARLRQLGIHREEEEENPALGVRGLRLLLRHPEILETQLCAILRASLHGRLRVLLPMVSSVNEVTATRQIYERCAKRLRRRGVKLPQELPPLGVMIETPAAALTTGALVRQAEFLALGTNDLTMYTLAVDRSAAMGSELYTALHPGVLRLLRLSVDEALRAHRPVCVCGEMASDPRVVALLIGMGLRSFSMSAALLPPVKRMIRSLSLTGCDDLYRQVMLTEDPLLLNQMVRQFAV